MATPPTEGTLFADQVLPDGRGARASDTPDEVCGTPASLKTSARRAAEAARTSSDIWGILGDEPLEALSGRLFLIVDAEQGSLNFLGRYGRVLDLDIVLDGKVVEERDAIPSAVHGKAIDIGVVGGETSRAWYS